MDDSPNLPPIIDPTRVSQNLIKDVNEDSYEEEERAIAGNVAKNDPEGGINNQADLEISD